MKQEVQKHKQPQPQKQQQLGKGKEGQRFNVALDGLSRAMYSFASRALDSAVVVIDEMTNL